MKRNPIKASFVKSNAIPALPIIEFSEEQIIEMRKIISKDRANIKQDFITQMRRLDDFIKKHIGVIPREKDFVNWFFDKKRATQWGKNLPKVTDDDIIAYAKIYLKELQLKIKSNTSEANKKNLLSYRWIKDEEPLYKLYSLLIPDFIDSQVSFDNFRLIFSGTALDEITNKVIWIKVAKNKLLNKRALCELIDMLSKNGFIIAIHSKRPAIRIKLLESCFTSIKGDFKFHTSNLPDYTHSSNGEIASLLKALK